LKSIYLAMDIWPHATVAPTGNPEKWMTDTTAGLVSSGLPFHPEQPINPACEVIARENVV
jgi:hypothetical protein